MPGSHSSDLASSEDLLSRKRTLKKPAARGLFVYT